MISGKIIGPALPVPQDSIHRALKSPQTPIHRLPDDILSSLFLFIHDQSDRCDFISSDHPSVRLSHVCRRWRDLAISTPLLWTSIVLEHVAPHRLDMQGVTLVERCRRALEAWTVRSRSCPLLIMLRVRPMTPQERRWASPLVARGQQLQDCTPAFKAFTDLLCSSSKRWKQASFRLHYIPPHLPFFSLLRLPSASVPLLEHLELDICPGPTLATGQLPPLRLSEIALYSTPSLRKAVFPIPWENVLHAPLVWSNLTHLLMSDYLVPPSGDPSLPPRLGSHHALEILHACPNLVDCTFVMSKLPDSLIDHEPVGSDSEVDSSVPYARPRCSLPPIISLPHLQSLMLVGTSSDHAFPFSLHLPALRSLTLFNAYGESSEPDYELQDVVFQWVDKFGPQLRHVSLAQMVVDARSLVDILKALPNLEAVELQGPPDLVDDQVLEMLTPKPSYQDHPAIPSEDEPDSKPDLALCPHLRLLAFDFDPEASECGRASHSALLQLVDAKSTTPSPMENIEWGRDEKETKGLEVELKQRGHKSLHITTWTGCRNA